MPDGLLQAFLMIFLAEMGDKSQFLMIAMSAEYRIRDILFGVLTAIGLLNLLAIGVGSALGRLLPLPLIALISGIVFLLFAYLGLREQGGETEALRQSKSAVPAIIGTYFLAELGDKTQLTVLALSAEGGSFSPLHATAVFFGATLGLFGADLLGLLIGYGMGKRLPVRLFRGISFSIMSACGVIRLLDGLQQMLSFHANGNGIAIAITAAVMLVFSLACFGSVFRKKHPQGGLL